MFVVFSVLLYVGMLCCVRERVVNSHVLSKWLGDAIRSMFRLFIINVHLSVASCIWLCCCGFRRLYVVYVLR